MATTECHNDDLVRLLNKKGYQPVMLPRTNVRPPEMYTYADQRLIRRGPLTDYLPDSVTVELSLSKPPPYFAGLSTAKQPTADVARRFAARRPGQLAIGIDEIGKTKGINHN
jgi:hypothetical protein